MFYVRFINPIFTAARPLGLGSHQDVALTCALIAEDMFDAGSHLRAPMVARLLLLVQAAPAAALAVNSALVAAFPQLLLARLGPVSRVRPDGAAAVLVVQDLIEHLAVVHAGVGDRVAPDQLVLLVRLASGVALALLLVDDLQKWTKGVPVDDAVQSG